MILTMTDRRDVDALFGPLCAILRDLAEITRRPTIKSEAFEDLKSAVHHLECVKWALEATDEMTASRAWCEKHHLGKRLLPSNKSPFYDRYECRDCRREWNSRETERRRARRKDGNDTKTASV